VVSDSIFLDVFFVNRCCALLGIIRLCGLTNHSSPVTVISEAISEWSATQFSLTFSLSTGAVRS
jgi:hypothetical protein